MDIRNLINEGNKRIRHINDTLLAFNKTAVHTISSGDTYTIVKNTTHSIGWELESGASVNVTINGDTVSFSINFSLEWSNVNSDEIELEAVSGDVKLIMIKR